MNKQQALIERLFPQARTQPCKVVLFVEHGKDTEVFESLPSEHQRGCETDYYVKNATAMGRMQTVLKNVKKKQAVRAHTQQLLHTVTHVRDLTVPAPPLTAPHFFLFLLPFLSLY